MTAWCHAVGRWARQAQPKYTPRSRAVVSDGEREARLAVGTPRSSWLRPEPGTTAPENRMGNGGSGPAGSPRGRRASEWEKVLAVGVAVAWWAWGPDLGVRV